MLGIIKNFRLFIKKTASISTNPLKFLKAVTSVFSVESILGDHKRYILKESNQESH